MSIELNQHRIPGPIIRRNVDNRASRSTAQSRRYGKGADSYLNRENQWVWGTVFRNKELPGQRRKQTPDRKAPPCAQGAGVVVGGLKGWGTEQAECCTNCTT
jgi:hypothetical protein